MLDVKPQNVKTKENVTWFKKCIYLSYDGELKTPSYDWGGGGLKCPPIFICESNRKSDKIMHCVEKKKILFDSFKVKAIFHVILEIDR